MAGSVGYAETNVAVRFGIGDRRADWVRRTAAPMCEERVPVGDGLLGPRQEVRWVPGHWEYVLAIAASLSIPSMRSRKVRWNRHSNG